MIKNYSYYINELKQLAKLLNVKVKTNFKLEVSGRTHYVKGLVEINEPKAKSALMTLAHELGHYKFYLKNKHKDQPPVNIREKAAYLLGWQILKKIEANITKDEWKDYHKPDLLNIKETGGWLIEMQTK